jgi:hypothetical protein
VFENRLLRRIFGLKRDEVRGGQRKLHNEELHNSYSLPSIIRMTKSCRMRWSGHVARIGEMSFNMAANKRYSGNCSDLHVKTVSVKLEANCQY